MNRTSAFHPLAALAATLLLLVAVVMTASAQQIPLGHVEGTVVAASCQSPAPDNPSMGSDLGPMFQRAV